MSERRCGDCEFLWTDKATGRIECHREPPRYTSEYHGSEWMGVRLDDWCGEFHPRTEQPAGPRFKVGQRVVSADGDPGTVVQVHQAKVRVCWDSGWVAGELVAWDESELRPAEEVERP